jgi:capsular polysaccharide biosynthesis protein
MEKYINKHKAIIFMISIGASVTVWAYSTFITKDAWMSIDRRLERIEDCLIKKDCK